MTRCTSMLAGLLMVVTATAADPPTKAADINRYREYFLKDNETAPKNGAVQVTFLGATTLLFDDGETQLMTDGFFSRPSMAKTAIGRIATDEKNVDAALKRAKADRVKALFVAHSHYDHAFDVAAVVKKTGAKLHGSASTLNIGRGGDLRDEQMVLFEPGKEYTFGKFTVTVIKSKHSAPIKGLNDDLGQTIDKPLKQPAVFKEYKEGGSFDFVIRHGTHTIYINPGANYVEGALDNVKADVVFLSTGSLGNQPREFQDAYYNQTVGKVRPQLVIPIHWDNFLKPLDDRLEAMGDVPVAFDFVLERLKGDKIRFGILQGYQRTLLFDPAAPQ